MINKIMNLFGKRNYVDVKVKKLDPSAIIPSYAHEGDAGMDFYSIEDAEILPKQRKMIGTGISLELPEGYVSLIWGKSGLANKGLDVFGGVIEHTYRGEYKIILYNSSEEIYQVKKGNKIAQVLIQPICTARLFEQEELSETVRGSDGFGSTGIESEKNPSQTL